MEIRVEKEKNLIDKYEFWSKTQQIFKPRRMVGEEEPLTFGIVQEKIFHYIQI